ncbi:MAG: hypothetical protein LBM25_06995 [Bacteroidales bacterium]|jgi:PBP1b-binding outer membrane lipoprotein LpoB|nr:hypothetical protein [Bacteroidales bacterium]
MIYLRKTIKTLSISKANYIIALLVFAILFSCCSSPRYGKTKKKRKKCNCPTFSQINFSKIEKTYFLNSTASIGNS